LDRWLEGAKEEGNTCGTQQDTAAAAATASPAASSATAAAPSVHKDVPEKKEQPSPPLQLGRLHKGRHAWRDVAALLGVSPTVAPRSFTYLGKGAGGTVYATERLAFKCTPEHDDSDSDSEMEDPTDKDDKVEALYKEAQLYERLMQSNKQSDGGPFLPQFIFAGFVDFTGVPKAKDRFQFILVLSREGPPLDDEEVQSFASSLPASACVSCAALRSLKKLHANMFGHCDARAANFVLSAETAAAPELRSPQWPSSSESVSSVHSASSSSTSSGFLPRVLLIDLGESLPAKASDQPALAHEVGTAEDELILLRSTDCRAHPPITDSEWIYRLNLPTCAKRPHNWSDQKRIARNIAMRKATRHMVVAKEGQLIGASDSPTTGAAAATSTSPTAAAAASATGGDTSQQMEQPSPQLQLGRLHKVRHTWRDVASLLGVSPTVAPRSLTYLGQGAGGSVYATEGLAFKCTPEYDDSDSASGSASASDSDFDSEPDSDMEDPGEMADKVNSLYKEAELYERLMQSNKQQSDGGFLSKFMWAGYVDFGGVANAGHRFQFILVLSRGGPSLDDEEVQKSAPSLPAAACLACKAMRSLEKLHANQMTHGDVRSANFVLSAETAAAHLPLPSSPSSELASAAPATSSLSSSSDSQPRVLLIDLGEALPVQPSELAALAYEVETAEDELIPLRSTDCRAHPPITNLNWIVRLNLPTCAQRPRQWDSWKQWKKTKEMEGKQAISNTQDKVAAKPKEAQPISASGDQPANAAASPAVDDAIAAAAATAPSATATPASLEPLPGLPSPRLQLGRVNPGKHAWRDVAALLGVSPTVPPSSLEELGEGRCGIVYGTKELAFKCARLRRRRDVDSDDDAPNLGVELWAEAQLYERLMPHNRTSGDGGPFLPRLIFAGDVNFTGVPDAEDRFQFVLVLSREGPSLEDEEVQKYARALPASACLACAALRSLKQLHANKMAHGDVREANFVLSAETASAAQLPLPLPSLSAGSESASSSVSSPLSRLPRLVRVCF
jgi:serine/threonine protein kinase